MILLRITGVPSQQEQSPSPGSVATRSQPARTQVHHGSDDAANRPSLTGLVRGRTHWEQHPWTDVGPDVCSAKRERVITWHISNDMSLNEARRKTHTTSMTSPRIYISSKLTQRHFRNKQWFACKRLPLDTLHYASFKESKSNSSWFTSANIDHKILKRKEQDVARSYPQLPSFHPSLHLEKAITYQSRAWCTSIIGRFWR